MIQENYLNFKKTVMTLTAFNTAYQAATSDEERESLENNYTNQILQASGQDQTAMIHEIEDFVDIIKNRILQAKDFENQIVTIKAYCDARKVSRQYVYQEIKSGKFKTVVLPIYADHNGKKIEVGSQKFLSF
jgi:hypothetical protein